MNDFDHGKFPVDLHKINIYVAYNFEKDIKLTKNKTKYNRENSSKHQIST